MAELELTAVQVSDLRLRRKPRPSRSPAPPCFPRAWGVAGLVSPAGPAADCVSCRKELAEAHKTNKPCGKCHFYLLISKTFAEAGKGSSRKKQSSPKSDELMFANAEEEFFYEVRRSGSMYLFRWNLRFSIWFSNCSHKNVSVIEQNFGSQPAALSC